MLIIRSVSLVLLSAALLSACSSRKSNKDVARERLSAMGIEYTETAFVESVINRNLSTIELFLDSGMSPNVQFDGEPFVTDGSAIATGDTALAISVALNKGEVVSALLAHNANVNDPGSSGRFPLRIANGQMTRFLLEHGADANKIDKLGLTALNYAAIKDDSEAINALIEAGADTTAKNEYGQTPLMHAAEAGRINAVKTLLAGGAEVNARDICGYTALRLATEASQTEVVELLIKAGAKDIPIIRKRLSAREALKQALGR